MYSWSLDRGLLEPCSDTNMRVTSVCVGCVGWGVRGGGRIMRSMISTLPKAMPSLLLVCAVCCRQERRHRA
jgi:hypothetical protein